jgi:predicted acyl esterase
MMSEEWRDRLSTSRFEMVVEKNVSVRARDGILLSVDVYRPDAPGKFPALVSLSPYGKELQGLLLPSQTIGESAVWDGNIEAGDIPYFVSRGYVQVIGDLRGTGDSEGAFRGYFNRSEGEDGYDVVEWAAEMDWCDGNVGMLGRSYFAQVQVETAIQAPPHLKAIAPISEFSDFYRDMAYQGGVPGIFLYGLWDGRGGTSGCARKNPVSVMLAERSTEELSAAKAEAFANPDIANYPNFFHLLHYPDKNPPFFDVLLNPHDGPFHHERSTYAGLSKIKVPVLLGGSFGNINAKSCWKTFAGIESEKRLVVGGKSMADRPWREDHDLLLRWYDHWLKGIDTGALDESPITFFVYGENRWRGAESWPLPETSFEAFYLQGRGRIGRTPELTNDEPDSFLQEPLHLTTRKGGLVYESLPLTGKMTLIGPAQLNLFAALDQPDTSWIVKVAMLDPSGVVQPLGTSYLKAAHREIDPVRSMPGRPFHPHLRSEPVPLGEVCEYQIEMDPLACVFEVGSRLRLIIESMESAIDEEMIKHYHPHLCSARTTLHKVYRNDEHRSHLLLPVIAEPQPIANPDN